MYFDKYGIYIDEKNRNIFDFCNGQIISLNEEYYEALMGLLKKDHIDIDNSIQTELIEFLSNRNVEITPVFDIRTIKLNISNTCNMACKYCYANEGNYGVKDAMMTVEVAQDICDFIIKKFPKIKKIMFFGGEPLLNIDVIETVCNKLKNYPIRFGMVTNLSILNKKALDIIINNNLDITVSLDGPKIVNDMNRVFRNGAPSFDIVSRNIKKLQEYSKVKTIEVTCTKELMQRYSFNDIKKFIYDEFKINKVLFSDVVTDIDELKLDEKYFHYKMNSINTRVDDFFNSIMNDNQNECCEVNEILYCVLSLFSKNITNAFCNAGMMSILFDFKGNIWPCQAYLNNEKYLYGNIYDTEFKQIVNKNIIDNNKNYEKNCNKCIARYWCNKCFLDKENNINERCEFNRLVTHLVVEKISNLICLGEFEKFNDKILEVFK